MLDFLAAPFMFTAHILLWCGSLITGRMYILMEVEELDDDPSDQDGY